MKRMKKLLALALSGVMALSCVVTAGAAETPSDQYTGGTQSGKGVFESVLPDGVVKIVLPSFEDDAFNMILDPHGLIKATGGARYGGANVSFEGAAEDYEGDPIHLFFHNLADGAENTFSSKSDQSSIINKSSFPVDMTVSVEVEKGAAGDSFSLVAADAVKDAEGAAMYLGLQVVDATATDGEDDADIVEAVLDAETDTVAVALADDAEKVVAAPTVGVAGSSADATAKANEAAMISGTKVVFAAGVSSEEKTAIIEALTHADRAEDTDAGVDGITQAAGTATYAGSGTMTFDITIPEKTSDDVIAETYTIASTAALTPSIVKAGATFAADNSDTYADTYFSLPIVKTVDDEEVRVATIRGKIDAAKAIAAGNGATANISFTKVSTTVAPLSSATYSDTIDAFSAAYGYIWKADDPEEEIVEGTPGAGEYMLAYYKDEENFNTPPAEAKLGELQEAVVETPAKGILFNLVGAINSNDDWDDLAGAENNIDIAVIWDVAESAGNGTPKVKNKMPTLSVETAVNTATSPSTQTLKLNWTAGTGDYEGYAPKTGSGGAKYYKANATSTSALTVTAAGDNAFTISMAAVSRAATTTGHVVVFTCADKEDLEIEFPTGWNAG